MKNIFIVVLLFSFSTLYSQETIENNYAFNTFESSRVVVGHSVELLRDGEMDFVISHKFGRLNSGAYEFFGLDQAIIRLGLDYGIKDWLNIGIGRSSLNKMVDGFAKVRLLRQQTGVKNIPVSLVGLVTMSAITLKETPTEPLAFENRLAYTYQLLVARQFSERFSLQVAPTLAHYNLVATRDLKNDVISLGAAAKYQVTKSLSVKAEYFYTLPDQLADNKTNSIALGIDINTGGHVFQMHFSNSGGLTESAFLGDTTGDFFEGDIHFGFTINRIFKLKGRRY